jgi:hypothetical protein
MFKNLVLDMDDFYIDLKIVEISLKKENKK